MAVAVKLKREKIGGGVAVVSAAGEIEGGKNGGGVAAGSAACPIAGESISDCVPVVAEA